VEEDELLVRVIGMLGYMYGVLMTQAQGIRQEACVRGQRRGGIDGGQDAAFRLGQRVSLFLVLVVFFDDAFRRAYELVARSPPHACYRYGQGSYNNRRAERCAWIDIPCPFLRRPKRILDDGVEACFPQQERGGPCNVCVELVVQRSRAKHADGRGGEDDGHDEVRGDPLGHGVLVSGLSRWHQQFEELAGRAFGRLDPARVGEEEQQAGVGSQKAEREGLR
jgi:hypothetical protein